MHNMPSNLKHGLNTTWRSYDWAKDVLDHLAGASKAHNGDSLKVTPLGCAHIQCHQVHPDNGQGLMLARAAEAQQQSLRIRSHELLAEGHS